MRVLAFDSGVGGLSVVDALVDAGLDLTIDYLADRAWLPYGDKPDGALAARVADLAASVTEARGADCVILACNTASTVALEAVRARLAVPVVGVVPPIKPAAALTRTGVIGLLATPATIRRPYLDNLIARHAAGCRVIRVGSTALVRAAEGKLAGRPVPAAAVAEAIAALFEGPNGAELDVIALGCTHFPLLGAELAAAAPRAVRWLDSGPAIARRVAALLGLPAGGRGPQLDWFGDTGAGPAPLQALVARGFQTLISLSPDPPFAARAAPCVLSVTPRTED